MSTKEEQDRALKAFKKRLKLTRQDNESGYSGSPLSGGKVSSIVAVTPPNGFPAEIWDDLVAAGRLKRTPGQRTFELVQRPS